jgi:hypothetical protein
LVRSSELALVAVLLCSCVMQPVTVTPDEIRRHLPELRERGQATLETTPTGNIALKSDQPISLKFSRPALFGLFKQTDWWRGPVRDAADGCDGERGKCLLSQTDSSEITVARRLRAKAVSRATVTGAVLGVVLGVGAAFAVGFIVDHYHPSR